MAKMKLTGKEVMNLGRTSGLYHEGKTPQEISEIVKYPLEKILEWIEIIKKSDSVRALTKGEIK